MEIDLILMASSDVKLCILIQSETEVDSACKTDSIALL